MGCALPSLVNCTRAVQKGPFCPYLSPQGSFSAVGAQGVRPATGVSRGLNTSLSLSALTAAGCHGLASPASHHSPRSQ